MAGYRLHYFPESGNSYKVALMLAMCSQEFELVWTDFAGGETRDPEWRRNVNGMGEIPVLGDGGVRLSQTAPILLRLAERHGLFGATNATEHFEMLRWLFWDNHKLTSYLATYRFQRAFTPSADPKVLEFLRKRLDGFLAIADQHLSRQRFVVGDRPTVADLSMVGYLFYPKDETGYDLPVSYPEIAAWLERIAALPGWRAPYDLLPGKRMPSYI